MILQCNVCCETPIVEINKEPNYLNEIIYCPCCDKQLAIGKKFKTKLIWNALDTEFSKELDNSPVKIVKP